MHIGLVLFWILMTVEIGALIAGFVLIEHWPYNIAAFAVAIASGALVLMFSFCCARTREHAPLLQV